jgi:hypothetical protein
MSESPTAKPLIFRDAVRYCSSSDGETLRTSAMLSKPLLSSSAGSSEVASISSDSRSRIALAYSARFRRCKGERPGFGLASAALSMDVSRNDTSASIFDCAGLGMPCGGIIPPRSLRSAFSQTSASSGTRLSSRFSSVRPAVFTRSLWQVTQ